MPQPDKPCFLKMRGFKPNYVLAIEWNGEQGSL